MVDEHYLKLLAKDYPNIRTASLEIVNLAAILGLPKGTEYFFSDLHGEHEAFLHMLKSASGVIREKIDWIYGKSSIREREDLARLICNPHETVAQRSKTADYDEWCRVTIYQLVDICKATSEKYTRAKVRKQLSRGFDHIMDELLHAEDEDNLAHYYSEIIRTLTETDMAGEFIIELCQTISRLAIDKLHIVGDLFDRGPHPDYILNYLIRYDNVDFQWGNHDASWMGAAVGNWACIANVLRVSFSYNNFDMLEIGYGINLRPLAVFASETYKDDECSCFAPHVFEQNKYDPIDLKLAAKMHKAIAIIQFKVEAELARLHPEYNMQSRILLDKIDFDHGTVSVRGKEYPMRDTSFPTVDPNDPLAMTADEIDVMQRMSASFRNSNTLQKHIRFLLSHGSLYKKINNNLLFHGCIPMTESGEFDMVDVGNGVKLSGKAYFDYLDTEVRKAYFDSSGDRFDGSILWYLWSGGKSPLFGKSSITTFERYFIEDKVTHKEYTDPYYANVKSRATCEKILAEFGLGEGSHIINGHVPVKVKGGESPIKGEGLLYVIDGGMAKAYQGTTGIAGYTLIYNSRYISLAEHKPGECSDYSVSPAIQVVERCNSRITVAETDEGVEIKRKIAELKALVDFYRGGGKFSEESYDAILD